LLEHHCASPSVEPARVAAMTASALALSESFARSAVQSPCDYSVISTEGGAVVMVRVPAGDRALALSVGSDGSEVLAVTLRTALDTSRRIAAALS
jgi:predicted regulator of Ras-like GTPase activity (Roadblock/LC7/MglB family)